MYRLEHRLDLVWTSSDRAQGARTTFIKIWIVSHSVSRVIFSFATSPITTLSIERESFWILSTANHFIWVWAWLTAWSRSSGRTRCSVLVGPTSGHIESTITSSDMCFVELGEQVGKFICKFFLAFAFVILTEVWFITLTLETLIMVFILSGHKRLISWLMSHKVATRWRKRGSFWKPGWIVGSYPKLNCVNSFSSLSHSSLSSSMQWEHCWNA